MTPNLTIEKALLRHERANTRKAGHDFFAKYTVLHERLTKVEYAQAMQGFAGGNDHGPQHIGRVLQYLDALLGKHPLKVLGPYELFIAMMAVLYHDVGILLGRDTHAEKSAYLLSLEQNDYIFDAIDKEYMKIAVRDHSSSKSIEEDCQAYPHELKIRGEILRIRQVASLVRLADELDEDVRRASPDLEAKMRLPAGPRPPELGNEVSELPETSRFFWAFNQRVQGVAPDPIRKYIAITMKFRPGDETMEFSLPGKAPQLFVRLAMEKILKINKERIYCNGFLSDPIRYSRLELTLLPRDNDSTWTTPSVHPLGDTTTLEELWGRLPPALTFTMQQAPASLPLSDSRSSERLDYALRPTVWVLGSYSELDDSKVAMNRKIVADLGRSLAARDVRLILGVSDMLGELAAHYRTSAMAKDPQGLVPVILDGKLRQTDLKQRFSGTIGSLPDLAIIIGGGVTRGRVAEEYSAAIAASIPVLPVPCTGGAAATVRPTAHLADDLYETLANAATSDDTTVLVAALLKAVERYVRPRVGINTSADGPLPSVPPPDHPHARLKAEILQHLQTDLRSWQILAPPGHLLSALFEDLAVTAPQPWLVVTIHCRAVRSEHLLAELHHRLMTNNYYTDPAARASLAPAPAEMQRWLGTSRSRRLLLILDEVDHLFPSSPDPQAEDKLKTILAVIGAVKEPSRNGMLLLSGTIAHAHHCRARKIGSQLVVSHPYDGILADAWDDWANRRIVQSFDGDAEPLAEHLRQRARPYAQILENCLPLLREGRTIEDLDRAIEREHVRLADEIADLVPLCCRAVLDDIGAGRPVGEAPHRCLSELIAAQILDTYHRPVVATWAKGWLP